MKTRRVIAMVLAVIMVMSTAVTYAGVETYTTHYISALEYTEKTADFTYSDAWHTAKSTKYNNKLAIASLGLVLATESNDDKAISQLLSDMGFEKFKSNYATKSDKGDNFNVSYAMKDTGQCVIVPVVVGAYYTDEWVDNFCAGTSGDAKGYSSAAKKVANYVKSYIKSNKINKKKVKIWLAGFSRGAAISDLAAKTLTSQYGKDKVCAYCFESPLTNKGNGKKANIHHVRNKYDGVPRLLPSYMGFGIAGKVNKTIGGGDEAAMKAAFTKIGGNANLYASPSQFCWAKFNFSWTGLLGLAQGKLPISKVGNGDQKEFWDLALKRAKKAVPSRKKYTSVYSSKTKYAAKQLGVEAMTVEESFMGIISWFVNLSDSEKSAMIGNMGEALIGLSGVIGIKKLDTLFDDEANNFSLTKDQYTKAVNTVSNALGGNNKLKASIAGCLDLALDLIDTDMASDKQILGTVLYSDANGSNIERLMMPHLPETSMAWLMAAE